MVDRLSDREPYQPTPAGLSDGFVAKLTPAGNTLAYSTYLGGSGLDTPSDIAVDGTGAAYVTGHTESIDFPTASPYQAANAGEADAFVAKLTPSGGALAYATYLGGSGDDGARGIAVDGAGAAYIVGTTESTDFPTASPYQPASAGSSDAFVVKLTPSGGALAYATYLGGASDDWGFAIAVDGAGAAYLTGLTFSMNFPTAGFGEHELAGEGDAFIAKLPPAGAPLEYSTLLGGSNLDLGAGIAVDEAGSAYVVGTTSSNDFRTERPFDPTLAGDTDAFVVKYGFHGAPNGARCAADSECASGFCTDGVCCNERCGSGASDCRACSIAFGAATDGVCGPSTGNACDDGLACTLGTTCSAGTCAGGSSPCFAPTSCSEAGSGGFTCSACPAGTFSADGTGTSPCMPCTAGTWSPAGATSCTAWSDCPAGTYVATEGTATRDRVCSPCPDGTYSDAPNASSCTPATTCTADEYELTPPTPTSDRVCAPLTVCDADQYEATPPTPTSDRVCAPLTVCSDGEYEATPPTPTSDRVCTACTVCGEEEIELSPCSATADTVCQPAGDGGVSADGGVMSDGGLASDGGTRSDGGVRSDGGTSTVDAGADGGIDPGSSAGGCGCATPGRADTHGAPGALALLAALALARRRRHRP